MKRVCTQEERELLLKNKKQMLQGINKTTGSDGVGMTVVIYVVPIFIAFAVMGPFMVMYDLPWIVNGAKEHGVTKIAFEMHPGFCVYNPATLLRLREAVGDAIGANFDPSHLIWQGIDPVAAIRALKGAIYHVHAKDTKIDKYNTAVNGVLDTKHYGKELERSWVFRTVGYGNNESYWRDLVSNLRLCGYDKVLSIEHEDSVMSIDEGLRKAVSFLQDIVIYEEKPTTMSWA